MKMSISQESWDGFIACWSEPDWYRNLRYGQAFHNYFELNKCVMYKDKLDVLYNAKDAEAVNLIHEMFEIV